MKSFLLSLLLLCATNVMAQYETVLFEGEKVIGNWDGFERFAPSDFAFVEAGDQLVCEISDVVTGDGIWAAVQLGKTDWSELASFGLWDNPEATEAVFTLTYEQVEEIKANGVLVRGCYYTLHKVKLVTAAEPPAETVIWSGEWTCENWAGNQDLAWGQYNWGNFKFGDQIVIYVTSCGEWPNLRPSDNSWTALSCGTIELEEGDNRVVVIPNEEDIAKLQDNNKGLVLTGNNYILTKVCIARAGTTDNIATASTALPSSKAYDLQGRRTNGTYGLVIIGGKKFLKK